MEVTAKGKLGGVAVHRAGHGAQVFKLIYYYFFKLINLFLAALGLCCCKWAFSSCREQGLLLIAVRGPLIAVASLVAEHRL